MNPLDRVSVTILVPLGEKSLPVVILNEPAGDVKDL
jgi:hypothetical protein